MLVLASSSPRRKEILAAAGFQLVVRAPHIPEQRLPGEAPIAYVTRLAQAKADAVECAPGELILGADTTVVAGDDVLEKPCNIAEAARMLGTLAGREHQVITGICLRTPVRRITDYAATTVVFSKMSQEEIETYASSGEVLDKAGAYAIQGLASKFIERIDGCYFNVVGLPISLFYKHLRTLENSGG